jgi:hypothetical protein
MLVIASVRAQREPLQHQRKPQFPVVGQEKKGSCWEPQAAVLRFPVLQNRETCRTKVEQTPHPIAFCASISPTDCSWRVHGHLFIAQKCGSELCSKGSFTGPHCAQSESAASWVSKFLQKHELALSQSIFRRERSHFLIGNRGSTDGPSTPPMAARRPLPDVTPPASLDPTWLEQLRANPGKALRWTSQQQDSLRGR